MMMPNQADKTTENNGSTMYNDMDEVLTRPPAAVVRYGSLSLLFLLVILCSLSFLVKYNEGITAAAYIQNSNTAEINAPPLNGKIKKLFIKADTLVQENDKLIIINTKTGTDTLFAPFTGKVFCQRKLREGDSLGAQNLLYVFVGRQNDFIIKIGITDGYVNKIVLGQQVNLMLPGSEKNEAAIYKGEIISLPYSDTLSQKVIADARISLPAQDITGKDSPYLVTTKATAYIIIERKSLAAAFIGW